jgi:hypothetical protein
LKYCRGCRDVRLIGEGMPSRPSRAL